MNVAHSLSIAPEHEELVAAEKQRLKNLFAPLIADKKEWENSLTEEEKDIKEDWELSLLNETGTRIDV